MKDMNYNDHLKRMIFKQHRLSENFTHTELKFKLINFFRNNSYPTNDEVSEFMENLQLDENESTKLIYDLLSDFSRIGNIKNIDDSKFNQEQLEKGIDVEMEEHTPEDNMFYRYVAKLIAKDHLSEPGAEDVYYTELDKMEKEFEKK